MRVFVNSKQKDFFGTNLNDLLQLLEITDTKGMALAVNETVISKSEWAQIQLKENDKVIVIVATQGG